jgi:hypothetical protein
MKRKIDAMDLWTIISVSGNAATMWFRFADEPNYKSI